MTNPIDDFNLEVDDNIKRISEAKEFHNISKNWIQEAGKNKWSYNFRWMDHPAIQFPNDAWVMQEIIWDIKPDLIIECGIAHGGSIVYYASILALLDMADSIANNKHMNPNKPTRKVLGIDVDIREHNRRKIEKNPFINWIELKEGSSIDKNVVDWVHHYASSFDKVLVILDSNHTHDHVLGELNAYASLVSTSSYCVVFDTIIEDMPSELSSDRPWGPGNNPKTAVKQFLRTNKHFKIDYKISDKLQITVAPEGFLRRE